MHPFKSNSNAWNPCSMVVKPRDGHGPWTILNTGSTSHRRQAAPFACAEPWDAIVLPLSPLTPPWFLEVVFPYRWYRRLSLWLLCCLLFPTGPILIFGIVEWKWMKETDPSSDITCGQSNLGGGFWRNPLSRMPHDHPFGFCWWCLCVCAMLWKQSSETPWNTWNLEDFEHLLWFTKKENDGFSKIIPFLHSPFI